MKILNINSYYYSTTVHRELQLVLRNSKIDSITYVPLSREYLPRVECNYPEEEWIKKDECFNKVDRLIFHLKHKKILKNIVNCYNFKEFQILHAHSLFSNGYIAMKINERYKIPYIVAVRDTDVNIFFKRMVHLRGLGNKILNNAAAIIFLSKPYMELVVENYAKEKYKNNIIRKSHIIPNGIDEFWLRNMNTNKKIYNGRKINLLHVGGINKRKNITATINAAEVLINKGYEINLTAVGKIIDFSVFEKMKTKKFVKHIPQQTKEELINIYKENDILVVPSKTETFGLIYPEAMTQGLPVIYTRGQGFDGQFKQGEIGYSVKCDDEIDISEKILKIVNDYENISKNCIDMSDKFNWNLIMNHYLKIYEDNQK